LYNIGVNLRTTSNTMMLRIQSVRIANPLHTINLSTTP
jgi:hypothetical protein